ncbi:MAG: DmsE family decaheme c-type cytochrome [Proteobacteria bacterium]|nr:DmsE family decaheme c-type cytochrome [Pseudomonadota bacterium]MBU1688630.1 DmsE family decaheme c-type cytochrome [Pseudomonadota bacterium]
MSRDKYLVKLALFSSLLAATFMVGCVKPLSKLKEPRPIIPIQEYEKQLLGKLTSDYVGNENCLKGCHTHDKIALDFKSSTMGDLLEQTSSGMQIVDCESCHGPASEMMDAMVGLKEEVNKKEIIAAHKENLLDYAELPSGAKSLVCLKCHTANATFNIHNWNASSHAANEVTCYNCHPIHASADLITEPRAVEQLCLGCHLDVSAQFSLPSRHPVKEGKIYCIDCHDPHGTSTAKDLREMTTKESCGRCHTEKVGPFLYEHGDITEECTTCHAAHGSANNNLLKYPVTFLCKQCHPQHRMSSDDFGEKSQTFTRCTDCHSMVHGSDVPGVSSNGGLTR